MEHAPAAGSPSDFIRSPLGIACLMLASSVGGSWLKDRLATEQRDNGSAVRIEALEKRVDGLQSSALTSAQFAEFRTANDQRLDGIKQDIRDLIAELNSDRAESLRKQR